LAAILGVYAVLLLPTVGRYGIAWDEQTDIEIARSYLVPPDGWLAGSGSDPSQARLPMLAVALVYALLNRSDVILGRWVSCLVGALTLLGAYSYGRLHFDHRRGLVAAGLLATSPFFLSFARVAFTETDIYLACVLVWLLVCVARLQESPTVGRAALTGVMAGLAVSAKFTALAVFPALWFEILWGKARSRDETAPAEPQYDLRPWIVWTFVCALAGWKIGDATDPGAYTGWLRFLHYVLVLLGWLIPLLWTARHRSRISGPVATAGFVTGMALLTFLVIPPEHITNRRILRGLLGRAHGEMSYDLGFMAEAAALHVLSIVFKSGPIIGCGMLVSLLLSILQWRRPGIRFPALIFLGYFGGLVLLPLAQPFYTIPLLPILAVLAADQLSRLLSWRRWLALGLVGLAAVLWVVDLWLCVPDYNLNGYQWLGARPLAGRSSIGYRSVVQTPSDGVEQACEWLNRNAGPGERVLAYVSEWHIVRATTRDPAYTVEDGFSKSLSSNPDYVLMHINSQLRDRWGLEAPAGDVVRYPYDRGWLESHYFQVFSVPRAFGIEMASIWRRR
jgi:hypothetical protein